VRPFRLHIAPRLALSRTELVELLYNEHGLDNSGLTVENMMLFCTQALQYTGGEVREKAEQIIIALYRAVGAPVRDYLPQDGDRNRKIPLYKHLFDAFYKIDGRTPYDAKVWSSAHVVYVRQGLLSLITLFTCRI
jgi:centrosomal protein CEP104